VSWDCHNENDGADPILRKEMLEVVDNQLRDNNPPETRETLARLMSEGISEADAKIYIAQVVVVEMWHILRSEKPFNRERFVRNLRNLPEFPE